MSPVLPVGCSIFEDPASTARPRSSLFFPESVPTTCSLIAFFPVLYSSLREGQPEEESQMSSDKRVPIPR